MGGIAIIKRLADDQESLPTDDMGRDSNQVECLSCSHMRFTTLAVVEEVEEEE